MTETTRESTSREEEREADSLVSREPEMRLDPST